MFTNLSLPAWRCNVVMMMTDKILFRKEGAVSLLNFAFGIDGRYFSCHDNIWRLGQGSFRATVKDIEGYFAQPPQPFTFPATKIKDPTAKIRIGKYNSAHGSLNLWLDTKLDTLKWPVPDQRFLTRRSGKTYIKSQYGSENDYHHFPVPSSFYYLHALFPDHEEELYSNVDGIWYFVTNQQLIEKKIYERGTCWVVYQNGATFSAKMTPQEFLNLSV